MLTAASLMFIFTFLLLACFQYFSSKSKVKIRTEKYLEEMRKKNNE